MFIEALNPEQAPAGQARMDLCIRAHGGLTWSGPRNTLRGQSNCETQWAFGFDCAHAGDLVPSTAHLIPAALMQDDVYRDRDYVIGETSRLAAQLRIVHRRGYR
jgi:hypothetical protein